MALIREGRKGDGMKEKGFTLIELLTVIVILGLISIIAVPTVTKILNDSKENTFKISMDSLLKTVKKDYQLNARTDAVTYHLEDNILTCSNGCTEGHINIKYSGDMGSAFGDITINNDVITISITKGKLMATYNNTNKKILIEESSNNNFSS